MKKFIAVFALLIAGVASTFAQTAPVPTSTETGAINVRPGRNVAKFNNGTSLIFVARGSELSGVEVRLPSGQNIKFNDDDCRTCSNPQPPKPCTGELRCVYSEKHKATICFCIPKLDISSGGGGATWQTAAYMKLGDIKGE